MMKKDYSKQLIGKTVIVEEDCYIGPNVEIISDYIHIKKHSKILELKAHCPEKFIIGECSYIGKRNNFGCKSFESGNYLWLTDDVEIGRGGWNGPNSIVKLGNACMVCEKVMINPSDSVIIGDDVGIGTEVQIWTHGSYLNVLDGYPANFAPVKIGSHVWLPARNVVLPGVEIGDNCVIGLGSLINKNVPTGCLAGGMPIKILKENVYPIKLTSEEKNNIVNDILQIWEKDLLKHKNIDTVVSINYDKETNSIKLSQTLNRNTILHIDKHSIEGHCDIVVEDLRDFLRRRGIKLYTGLPFKSITPTIFTK
jgi:acetyltransferase-like isoleucine patch superfamily enzyme